MYTYIYTEFGTHSIKKQYVLRAFDIQKFVTTLEKNTQ